MNHFNNRTKYPSGGDGEQRWKDQHCEKGCDEEFLN